MDLKRNLMTNLLNIHPFGLMIVLAHKIKQRNSNKNKYMQSKIYLRANKRNLRERRNNSNMKNKTTKINKMDIQRQISIIGLLNHHDKLIEDLQD